MRTPNRIGVRWPLAVVILVLVLAVSASAATDPLDPTFGSGGKATVDRGSSYDELYDVASLADGRALVGVNEWRYPTQQEFAVMRLGSNGMVDTTFGNAGTAVTDIGGNYDYARAVLPLSSGAILTVGYSLRRCFEMVISAFAWRPTVWVPVAGRGG